MGEILTEPPAEEGDNQEAAEGTDPIDIDDGIEDADELEDEDPEDDNDTDG